MAEPYEHSHLTQAMKDEIIRLAEILEDLNLEILRCKETLENAKEIHMHSMSANKETPIEIEAAPAILSPNNPSSHKPGCQCNECKKARKREWYHKNKDRLKERARMNPKVPSRKVRLVRDEIADRYMRTFTEFAQEAEKCIGDPSRLMALREAAYETIRNLPESQ